MCTHMQFTLFVCSSGFTCTRRLEVSSFFRSFSRKENGKPGDKTVAFILHGASRVLLEKLIASQYIKKFPEFMDLEGLLLCSQNSTTCSYYEPDGFSSHTSLIYLFRSILIIPFHLRLCFPSGHFPLGFST